jgi:predicted 3-demethylubiquinone-9 3-methyltransferase (glyoxalase superfamily)
MHPITPFLWFKDEAEDAAKFYVSLFKNSKLGDIARYIEGSPGEAGSVMTVSFELCGQEYTALNGGPIEGFDFTPAISFFVSCETMEELNTLWEKLSDGGSVMMEKQEYPWSEQYGWLNDKFGVSWQLNLTKTEQNISPALMFVGDNYGKAEEAINLYTTLFPNSKIGSISKNGAGHPTEKEGTVQYASFFLNGQEFKMMENSANHQFTFTPATSFVVMCDTQEEIDTYWEKLTADGGEEVQCGWLNDKYGIAWQITPVGIGEWISTKAGMAAMMKMKKLDIATLKKAAGK